MIWPLSAIALAFAAMSDGEPKPEPKRSLLFVMKRFTGVIEWQFTPTQLRWLIVLVESKAQVRVRLGGHLVDYEIWGTEETERSFRIGGYGFQVHRNAGHIDMAWPRRHVWSNLCHGVGKKVDWEMPIERHAELAPEIEFMRMLGEYGPASQHEEFPWSGWSLVFVPERDSVRFENRHEDQVISGQVNSREFTASDLRRLFSLWFPGYAPPPLREAP